MLNRLTAILIATSFAAAPALADDPYTEPDDSWISISGTVASPEADSFILDYGDGVVTVEVDDWDSYGDAYGLLDGDEVTVYGKIDDDLYELTTIEASSVYVEDLNTYFYASAADEEDAYWSTTAPIVISRTTVRGTVTDVDPLQEEFTIDTGASDLTVDTSTLGYNPLDEVGFQQIEEGDVVSASGAIDHEFFDGRELEIDTLVTLYDAPGTDG